MNIRLSIYDIFSRIVPGGFYLFTFVEFARIVNLINFDWATLKDLGIVPSLALTTIAYVIGSAMDRVGSAWYHLFVKSNQVLGEFKNEHKEQWKLDFEEKDWPILRAYIYTKNLNIADEIDRHNALSIMMRNIGLGLALLAVCETIQLIKTNVWALGILVAALIFFSYQITILARALSNWFYRSIFETIIAYRLNLEDMVKPAKLAITGKRQVKK